MSITSKAYQLPEEEFIKIIKESSSCAEAMRTMGYSCTTGNSHTTVKRRIKELNINIEHWADNTKNAHAAKKTPHDEYFAINTPHSGGHIRERLLKDGLLEYRCSECGNIGEWNGQTLVLQVDHINGDHCDNRLENLRFLCPNCHSQTDTYCGKNINTSINEEEVLRLIKEGKTIRQTLLEIGVSDGSANYTRVYQILDKNNIQYVNFSHNQHLIEKPNQPHYCVDCGKEISYHSTRCKECEFEYRKLTGEHTTRQVERPSKEELLKDIATSSFSAVGRKYGVSDNAIRKWCLAYGLPTHKKEIKELYTLIG